MPKKPEDTEYRISAKLQKFMRNALDEEGFTQKAFAAAVGVSHDVIGRTLLYQCVPSMKSLIKLADYFQVPILYMFEETEYSDFTPAKAPTTFFERLEQLTKEKVIKYSALSHSLSFASNAVYEWFRTNSLPSLDYLKQLAKYFDVSVDYLLGRTDDRK